MKFKKSISLLVLLIVVFSFLASLSGVLSINRPTQGQLEFKSIYDQTIRLYGKGIYRNDSIATASQAVSQDIVTIILGIPLLLVSVFMYRKGNIKGRLLLAGTLGYFLYTYTSYAFLAMYNQLFLVYVLVMSASFFAFTLTMMSFDLTKLSLCFKPKLPVRFIGGFLIFFAVIIGLMWVGRIVPPLMNGIPPVGIDHYTSLVIQVLDLGFIVPISFLTGVLLIKRKSFGYLLASIVCIKGITMATAVSAMVIGQLIAGVKMSMVEIVVFPVINLIIIYCLYLIMKNINENAYV